MSFEDDSDNEFEDVSEDIEFLEEGEQKKDTDLYRIEIQGGGPEPVFSGTITAFEKNFFLFPEGISDEDKIAHIAMWAYEQGWGFKSNFLH